MIQLDDRWLMIRNTYGRGHWTFPGGTVGRRETPEETAIREVSEEVGITLASVEPIGIYHNRREHKRDTVYCFRASVTDEVHQIDPFEIAEAGWFRADELPSFRGPSVNEILALLEPRKQT